MDNLFLDPQKAIEEAVEQAHTNRQPYAIERHRGPYIRVVALCEAEGEVLEIVTDTESDLRLVI